MSTDGARLRGGPAAYRWPAQVRAWAHERQDLVHHLVSAAAMLACLLAGHRQLTSLLVVLALVTILIACVVRARGSRSAQELALDLAVMAVLAIAMGPWFTGAPVGGGAAMSMSGGSMSGGSMSAGSMGHGHADLSVFRTAGVALASTFWVVLRVRLLIVGGPPRVAACLGAAACLGCLAWMLV